MDLLDQHEAFLRAIFDDPEDDTPRIIYADFLEENGQEDRAAFIRAQCEFPRLIPSDLGDPEYHPRLHELLALQARLRRKLLKTHPEQFRENATYWRGFPSPPESVEVTLADLTSPVLLREKAVQMYPEWFSATAAKVVGGQVRTSMASGLMVGGCWPLRANF